MDLRKTPEWVGRTGERNRLDNLDAGQVIFLWHLDSLEGFKLSDQSHEIFNENIDIDIC